MDEPRELARNLAHAVQMVIDVVWCQEVALADLADPALREEVGRIKADNERHVLELSEVLRALGQQPPRFRRDFRGVLMTGVAAIRAGSGRDGALRALHDNADLLEHTYDELLEFDLPLEVGSQVQGYLADEARHRETIDRLRREVPVER